MNNSKLSERTSIILIIFGLVIFIGSFFILAYPTYLGSFGTLGDLISGIAGTLLSLAGVLLFYSALKSQQESLNDQKESTKANIDAVKKQTESLALQMKEFELQRKELEETRKVFEDQSETLGLQRFENTFFSLMKLRSELLQNIYHGNAIARIYGMEAFEKMWDEFSDIKTPYDPSIRGVSSIFDSFYQRRKNALDPYFTTIFHILQILDRSDPPHKNDYVNLFVAQLSELEKQFIFYWAAKPEDGNLIKPLLEKYHVLRYLNPNRLIQFDHKHFYSDSAFLPN